MTRFLPIIAVLAGLSPFVTAWAEPTPSPAAPQAAITPPPPAPQPSNPLEAVRARGRLACATVQSEEDWNDEDRHGDLTAIDAEICRAVATAILGDPDKVDIAELPGEPEALTALQSGAVQLAVGLSPSAEKAVAYGVAYGPPIFLDTQRLMVAQATGFTKLADLRNRLICVMENTPGMRELRDYMTAHDIAYAVQAHSEQGEMDEAVAVARCLAGWAMESRLADMRADFPANSPPFVMLPERFGLAPVVPAFRYGDPKFALIVQWTVSALIEAEALGIDQSNVGAAKTRTDMRAERLLGGDRAVGQALGLPRDWAAQVIAAVGNYGEIFDRTLGKRYHLERGYNALWTAGGLMYPTPME